tara:strand:- start:255 stop:590 length:336 start_codon:yes stop_codon:yes gene_type:complete
MTTQEEFSNQESIVNDDDYNSEDEPNPCGSLGKTGTRKKILDMDFDELKEYTTKLMLNKKKYIRKYQKSDKGKAKIKVASKKFYDKNREKILEKKRIAYLKKKQLKMGITN